ncbi:hypothetical protein [Pseudoalteromonas luteoviolacea]|nr:hypothetical protein [Pseudoalteromonas luteoviolacea]
MELGEMDPDLRQDDIDVVGGIWHHGSRRLSMWRRALRVLHF